MIHGKNPGGSAFANLQASYALDNGALLAAINSHPLYAGWADYDNNPDADLEPDKGMPA